MLAYLYISYICILDSIMAHKNFEKKIEDKLSNNPLPSPCETNYTDKLLSLNRFICAVNFSN